MPAPLRTLFALLIIAALAPAAEPTPAQLADAGKRLNAFRDALPKAAAVAGSLDAAKVSFAEAKAFDANSDKGLAGLLTAADNLARLASDKDEKKRTAEAQRFMGILGEANPKAQTATVEKLARDVGAAKFGVIGEATDSAFKLNAAELAKDPAAAKKRVADWVKAMDEQAKRLDAAAKDLGVIAARAKANRETLAKIDGKAQEFIRLGGAKDVVNKNTVDNYFENGLLQKYDRLKESADAAAKRAADAKTAQAALLKAVKDNAKLLDAK